MFNLMIILSSTINSESKGSNNYKIAKYIIEHIHDLGNCTLAELAANCYVSNSSVSRFCREIGLADFNELKMQIAKAPSAYHAAETKYRYPGYKAENVFRSYGLSVIDNLNCFLTQDLNNEIRDLVNDIQNYQNVAAFGYMQSECIALSLQYDLQTCGKPVYTSLKFIDQIDYIKHAGANTLIIIFSHSGTYFKSAFPRTNPFRKQKNKPKIYVITSHPEIQPDYVDHCLQYSSRKESDFSCHPYPLMMIADMIAIMYADMSNQWSCE